MGTHSAFGEGLHTRAHTPKQEPSLLRSQCGFVPSVKFFLFRHTFIYIHFPVLCEPHYISRGKNSGKVAAISFIPNRFSFRFSTSRTNGSRSLSQTKASTHSAFGEKSHTSAYTAKHGAFRMGALLLPSERSTRFGNPAWPGFKTANFAAFGAWSWVLPKNAESLRDSDALMRVAVPRRRGPAGLRDLFRFCRNCGLYIRRSWFSACARHGWYHYPRCALCAVEIPDGRLSKRLICRFLRSGSLH